MIRAAGRHATRARATVLGTLLATAACAPRPPSAAPVAASKLPRTRAERSGYTETSRYADVVAFLDSLQALRAPMWRGSIGKTTEGRDIPVVVLSRPQPSTPEQAVRLGRPVVYVQANIHAGEVEGKEAVQALVRDLAFAPEPNVLDSIVLIAVPIYNADGNERFAPQAKNRPEQNGPELVGQRPNAQGLDLNRDYVKAEAPETRASLAAFNRWNPDVFVDLHTTDGSFHGYALTYAPSLSPAAFFGGVYARDSLLPELRRRMRARHGFETFDYGNFALQYGADINTDTVRQGWFTYDARPRFGTNYVGLRGRVAILSEAYSHDPFERRVKSTYAFVREILSLTAERAAQIRSLTRRADSSVTAWGEGEGEGEGSAGPKIPLRSELTRTPVREDVVSEDLAQTGDSSLTQPGVPRGLRRTGHFRTLRLPVYDRFTPTVLRQLPCGYVLSPADTAAVRLLRLHGVRVERVAEDWRRPLRVELFSIDTIVVADSLFQGHHQVRLEGYWSAAHRAIPAGSYFVPTGQPLGIVAFYLLEPESDDGLTTWNVFDARLARDELFPVWRVSGSVTTTK